MIPKNASFIDNKTINSIAKKYKALDYSVKLLSHLQTLYPTANFQNHTKFQLQKTLNDTLLKFYTGEAILKYKLFEKHINKKNIVAAFEIKVNNSRVDFLSINGCTTSFEIKSKLDNLSKIEKQMMDYEKAFEYNYVIVDESHLLKVKELISSYIGIWIYQSGSYKEIKKAKISNKINPSTQLSILTKAELKSFFGKYYNEINSIKASFSDEEINSRFKLALKSRYKKRWEFVIENEENILPMDLQFFFKTTINPNYIYCQ